MGTGILDESPTTQYYQSTVRDCIIKHPFEESKIIQFSEQVCEYQVLLIRCGLETTELSCIQAAERVMDGCAVIASHEILLTVQPGGQVGIHKTEIGSQHQLSMAFMVALCTSRETCIKFRQRIPEQ